PDSAKGAHLGHPQPALRVLDEVHARKQEPKVVRRPEREVDRVGGRLGPRVAPPGEDRRHPRVLAGHPPVSAEVAAVEHRHAEIAPGMLDEALHVKGAMPAVPEPRSRRTTFARSGAAGPSALTPSFVTAPPSRRGTGCPACTGAPSGGRRPQATRSTTAASGPPTRRASASRSVDHPPG